MKLTLRHSARIAVLASALIAAPASAQSVLFDFNNAPDHTSLPLDQVAGGITAHLSATGQGFSIQDQSSPVFPQGFSGLFLYPNSVFLADLLVSFDHPLTDFSLLYAMDELGCDDSATLRVSAFMNGTLVGFADHTAANPGTYPVDTLACTFPQVFNSVVIHYQHAPPTCQDYGVVFFADDMRVTPMTSSGTAFCFGDGSSGACPCANTGAAGRGCENSASTGGALLGANGVASLAGDSLQFHGANLLPNTLCIVFQGHSEIAPLAYGDGLRCAGGSLKRMFLKTAVSGAISAPEAGDPSVSARALALGDPIPSNATRVYHVYYRDGSTSFCPAPQGSTFNASNAVSVLWAP